MKTGLIVLSSYFFSIASNCATTWERKEMRELNREELERYIRAVKSTHVVKGNTSLTTMEKFSKQHMDAYLDNDEIHFTPQFLIWHRRMIREYEKELQKYDPKVTLPYWDWSLDSNKPHYSKILTNPMMGGNGNSKENYNVVDGPFAKMRINYPEPHFLSRSFDQGYKISPFATLTELKGILNNKVYSKFAKQLEEVHGDVHVFVGGDYDFGLMTAPSDPLFYIHHSFIELMLVKWQDMNSNVKYDGIYYGMPKPNEKDKLYGYNHTVKETWTSGKKSKNKDYCYTYSQWPKVDTNSRSFNSATNNILLSSIEGLTLEQSLEKLQAQQQKLLRNNDRHNTNDNSSQMVFSVEKIPEITPKPEAWIKKHKFDLKFIREMEAKRNMLRKLLNSLPTSVLI